MFEGQLRSSPQRRGVLCIGLRTSALRVNARRPHGRTPPQGYSASCRGDAPRSAAVHSLLDLAPQRL